MALTDASLASGHFSRLIEMAFCSGDKLIKMLRPVIANIEVDPENETGG